MAGEAGETAGEEESEEEVQAVKTTVTKTVTETQILCDHCGGPVIYSEQSCVVCGKCACHECFIERLTVLVLDKFPKFWPVGHSMRSFHAYACKGCENDITRLYAEVKKKTEQRNALCRKWFTWHSAQLEALNLWKEEAEKKLENSVQENTKPS